MGVGATLPELSEWTLPFRLLLMIQKEAIVLAKQC